MQTLLADLTAHATSRPGKPFAVVWESDAYSVLSYADLRSEALTIGAALRELPRGGVVHIVLRHSAMVYPTYIGCMLAGLIPSFLPFPTPKQDAALYFSSHRALFERSPPAAIITSADLMAVLRETVRPGTPVLDLDTLSGPAFAGRDPGLDEVALLQHSSGTTGLKKGIALTFRQIAKQVAAYAPIAGLSAESVTVSWLPLYHDMGLFTGFLIPLSLGMSVVSVDAFEWVRRPSLLLRLIETFGGTHAWLPNFAFQHVLASTDEGERFDLSSLQSLVSCSEPVKPAVLRRFAARFGPSGMPATRLRACYAMAETGFATTQSVAGAVRTAAFAGDTLGPGQIPRSVDPALAEALELASNGPPIPGIAVGIATKTGIATSGPTPVGEIVVRGDFVFAHYHDAPDLTAASRLDDWYRTGDSGFLQEGELFVCGRLKEVVIVHGRNYYCHDIEALVSDVPGVVPGRVVAIGTDGWDDTGEQLVLLAECTEETSDRTLLRRAVKSKIFNHLELTPRQVEFVPRGWLIKTTSGKLSRVENARRWRERPPQHGSGA